MMNDLPQRYIHILKDAGKRYTKSCVQWFNNNKWICLLPLLALYVVVVSKRNSKLIQLKGKETPGRNYSIQYIFPGKTNYQKEIDTLLDAIEQALDVNKADSEVASFNHHNSEPFYYQTPFLYPLLAKSKEVYNHTQGAFDPTVAPLVKLWKESIQADTRPTELDIWHLRPYVGLDYIVVNERRVKKLKEEISINLNSLIPSYEVDAIASLLKSHEIQNFCIQFGNEILTNGTRTRKKHWEIVQQIVTQQTTGELLDIHINLQNKAVSIIKNYTTEEHDLGQSDIIIDPITGHLATAKFIAAFVFAEDCITARTYATAFMSKNFLTASAIAEQLDSIDLFLIYKDETGTTKFYHSSGLQIQHTEGSNNVIIQQSDKKTIDNKSTENNKEERD